MDDNKIKIFINLEIIDKLIIKGLDEEFGLYSIINFINLEIIGEEDKNKNNYIYF